MQAEDITRDIGPNISLVGGTPHSRYRPDGRPISLWETEYNHSYAPAVLATDRMHVQAKALTRYLSSYVNKGLDRVYFFSVNAAGLPLVDQPFFDTLKANKNTAYPGDNAGGETIDVIHRFLSQFAGAQNLSGTRPLSLAEIDDFQGNVQFTGDGTAAHPSLYNRDVLGFFPYQVTSSKIVIPMYIMTRDMSKVYDTSAPTTDPTRFDMPQEHYRLTIKGLNGDNAASSLSMYDPLTDQSVPVTVFSHSSNEIVVDVELTDSPRLLTLVHNSNPPPAPTVTIGTNVATINPGDSATLSWNSTNATSCSAVSPVGWTASTGTSGSKTVTPPVDTTYTISCSGAGGATQRSVVVQVNANKDTPFVNISANPSTIQPGDSTTLFWTDGRNDNTCTASGGWNGTQTNNTYISVAPTSTTTYTLSCTGKFGPAQSAVTVTVGTSAPKVLTADLNHDGVVNLRDVSIFLAHYGLVGTSVTGDLNGDGRVNVFDLSVLLGEYSS